MSGVKRQPPPKKATDWHLIIVIFRFDYVVWHSKSNFYTPRPRSDKGGKKGEINIKFSPFWCLWKIFAWIHEETSRRIIKKTHTHSDGWVTVDEMNKLTAIFLNIFARSRGSPQLTKWPWTGGQKESGQKYPLTEETGARLFLCVMWHRHHNGKASLAKLFFHPQGQRELWLCVCVPFTDRIPGMHSQTTMSWRLSGGCGRIWTTSKLYSNTIVYEREKILPTLCTRQFEEDVSGDTDISRLQ